MHPSAWKGDSRNFAKATGHSSPPLSRAARPRGSRRLLGDPSPRAHERIVLVVDRVLQVVDLVLGELQRVHERVVEHSAGSFVGPMASLGSSRYLILYL